MRQVFRLWALLATLGAAAAVMPACSREPKAAPTGAGAASKADVGDTITCALDGMRMTRTADTPSAEYGGKTYYFCGEAEKQEFLKDPGRYAKP